MPTTVVSRSFATVAIDTFITDASRIITNCAAASVMSTALAAPATACSVASVVSVIVAERPSAAVASVVASVLAAVDAVGNDRGGTDHCGSAGYRPTDDTWTSDSCTHQRHVSFLPQELLRPRVRR